MYEETLSNLGASVWTYDFADPISTALEGAGRAGVLLALDAPTDMLASMYAAESTAAGQREQDETRWPEYDAGASEVDALRTQRAQLQQASVPDVCRLYALYKDTGKFINLADWYEAFVQALEVESRKHAEDCVADAQTRFSLAVNELAHMGLLGATSRKVDHVCRLVWDLPVNGRDEA